MGAELLAGARSLPPLWGPRAAGEAAGPALLQSRSPVLGVRASVRDGGVGVIECVPASCQPAGRGTQVAGEGMWRDHWG